MKEWQGDDVVFDTEVYPNFFLVAFRNLRTREIHKEIWSCEDTINKNQILLFYSGCRLISFNGNGFDVPILNEVLNGRWPYELCKRIISGEKIWQKDLLYVPANHIDIQEVMPLAKTYISLKMRGAQVHAKTIWSLPYNPDIPVSKEEAEEIQKYCINDLDLTEASFVNISEQIKLRENLNKIYNIDVRSKSDAQIFEAIMKQKLGKIKVPKKVSNQVVYEVPSFIQFNQPSLINIREKLNGFVFELDEDGKFINADWLKNEIIGFNNNEYRMGIGGLHSLEKSITHKETFDDSITDFDVTSYYPAIILKLNLEPELCNGAIKEYGSIVDTRIRFKKAGDKANAESYKIIANGGGGKYKDKWSIFYSPSCFLSMTICGQLSILMLADMFSASPDVYIVCTNTDGITIKYPRKLEQWVLKIVDYWQNITGFSLERADYKLYAARDVNNYIAIKTDNTFKSKGEFADPWHKEADKPIMRFHKNPDAQICAEALIEYIRSSKPYEKTIKECRDITRFVQVKKVTGGAVKAGEALGKVVRWYQAIGCPGPILYAENGHAVGESEGARPCQTLPDEFPSDINYDYYIKRVEQALIDIGYVYKKQISLWS